MTCFTEVNHQNRSFNNNFAVANIKYNNLGTPFFKRHIQNIDFQQNIMTFIQEQHSRTSFKNNIIKNNIQNFLQKHISPNLQKRTIHMFHTFTLLNVKNQFTLNQDQAKPYISQPKII